MTPVVHGHGRGMRLSTFLMYAACVVAFVAYRNGDKFSVMHLILLKSVVHKHGQGMRLGTCIMYATCAVAIVACMTGDGLRCPKLLHANKQHARAI